MTSPLAFSTCPSLGLPHQRTAHRVSVSVSRELGRNGGLVCVALVGLLLLTGCARTLTAEHAAPTRAIDCNYLPDVNADPGIVAGFDWTGEKHQYGEPVKIYVCVSSQGGGSVMVTPVPSGVAVTPAKRLLEPMGSGVEPFTVVVERGAAGKLWMRQLNREGHGVADIGGPVVVAEADGWHFAPSH